jgi:hypothetical protein
MRNCIAIVALLSLCVSLSCKNYKSGVFEGWTSHGTETSSRASYSRFDGRLVRTRTFAAPAVVVFSYEAEIDRGTLTLKIKQPTDEVTTLATLNGRTNRGDVAFNVTRNGDHQILICGDNASGKYSIRWNVAGTR